MSVSIVAGCMNRTENLAKVLHTWLLPEVLEIVIVDWGSHTSVSETLSYIDDPRIRVLQIVGVNRWLLSSAINFGVNHTTGQYILKLDCDNVLRKDFFQKHPICSQDEQNPQIFYTGDWQSARNENEKHLNGVVFVGRSQLLAVGGYNEHIRSYGWDDTDLYDRLCKSGLQRKNIELDSVLHLPHSDTARGGADLHYEIVKNMHVANRHVWNSNSIQPHYVKLATHGSRLSVYRPVDLERNSLSLTDIQTCELLALRTILNDHGYSWCMTRNKTHAFLLRLYYHRFRKKFYIEPKNGIGNRLRALASAAILAKRTSHNLIIVWRKDMHCDAEFHELFRDDALLVCSEYSNSSNFSGSSSENQKSTDLTSTAGTQNLQLDGSSDIYIASACVFSDSRTSWSLESHWLQKHIIPIENILQTINYYATKFDVCQVIGMHIRMGQPASEHAFETTEGWDPAQKLALEKNRSASHYTHFMAYVRSVLNTSDSNSSDLDSHSGDSRKNQKFLLCADNAYIYEEFAKNFGDEILSVEKSVYDRSLEQIQSAVVDIWLLSRCKYVLGSPWSSFTELVARLGATVKIAGTDFGTERYGLLFYPKSYNIGDDIQSLAARAFLPRVDYLVDRDDQTTYLYDTRGVQLGTFEQVLDDKRLTIIENGWFDGRLTKFPPHAKLNPCFISFHLNETKDLFENHGYAAIADQADMNSSMLDSCKKIQYLRKHKIGTRDMHTSHLLDSAGVNTYISGCLTLTLSNFSSKALESSDPHSSELKSNVYVVDTHILEPELLRQHVPEHILYSAEYICHGTNQLLSQSEKEKLALQLLAKYQNARLVITSRLHCALPCIAFGTPVIFLYKNMRIDPRFDNRMKKLLGNGVDLPKDWDWANPKLPAHTLELRDRIAKKLKKRINKFIN